jgi:hypothetical protein
MKTLVPSCGSSAVHLQKRLLFFLESSVEALFASRLPEWVHIVLAELHLKSEHPVLSSFGRFVLAELLLR